MISMKIISERERIHGIDYVLSYTWNADPSRGFSFDCDKDGNRKPHEGSQENYEKCVSGEYDVTFHGIDEHHWSYVQPAVGECIECKHPVDLDGFTNTCDGCGADYSMSGQQLAPREQWGEETGEAWWECL